MPCKTEGMENKISYGVSTWLWESPFTTETVALFPKIKQMGFDAVEIPVEDPELIDPARVGQALAENGLQGLVCGVFGPGKDLTHKDKAVHEHCFSYLQQCFDLCNSWGGSFVAGPMYSAVGKARMLPPEQRKREWDLAVKNVRKVCEMAASSGLSVALEPLNRFESDMVNTASDVMRLVNDINHPAARVLLDSFHMTIEEQNIGDAIRRVGDKLIHVQVSENQRGVPGSGLTPWHDFREGLMDIGYTGAIVIESFTPEIKELAGAVCIWKHLAESQDVFASDGLAFLKKSVNY